MIHILDTDQQEVTISTGTWSYTVKLPSAGTASLDLDENSSGFIPIENTAFSTAGGGLITIPSGIVRANLTGGAFITLKKVNSF